MKAIMKYNNGAGNVHLTEIPEPNCEKTFVKVRVKYSGICGTDLHILHDTFKNYPPVVLGHEFSGVVEEVGTEVERISVGDRVTILPSTAHTCGECEYCRTGEYVFCKERKGMGYGLNGSFTKFAVVREDMVYKLPENISLEIGALAEPLACVVKALEELDISSLSDDVLISGPGPLGLIAASLLKSKGHKVIISGTDIDEFRFEIAKKLKIDYIINIDNENLIDRVLEITKGNGVNLAIECAGHPDSVNSCLSSLGNNGRLLQLGIIGKGGWIDYDQIIYKQIKVQGSLAHSLSTWKKVIQLFENDNIELEKIISHKYELDDWQEAFNNFENKKSGKVLLYHE